MRGTQTCGPVDGGRREKGIAGGGFVNGLNVDSHSVAMFKITCVRCQSSKTQYSAR